MNTNSTTYDVVTFSPIVETVKAKFGRKFHQSKAEYVLAQCRSAIVDQKVAMLENGIPGVHDDYNEGWLAGFIAAEMKAQKLVNDGVFFMGNEKKFLNLFLQERLDLAIAAHEMHPNVFSEGHVDGFSEWIKGLRAGWVDY